MRHAFNIILGILVLLSVSSGVTKVLLMEQDVEFFGSYGFTNPILITFGALQILGGLMLLISKLRLAGALLVSVTFIISLVVLVLEQSIVPGLLTLISLALLAYLIRQTAMVKPRTAVEDSSN
ncbi:MAG: hypothetical protein GKR91_07315 [Pseudomonadales bacterium]|nr:hypothetical protein [Pseudomonadales bacterium]